MRNPTDFDYWIYKHARKILTPMAKSLTEICEVFANIGRDKLLVGITMYGFTFLIFFTIILEIIYDK